MRGLNNNKDCWVRLFLGSDIRTTKPVRVENGVANIMEIFEFTLVTRSSGLTVELEVGYTESKYSFGKVSVSVQDAEILDPKWIKLGKNLSETPRTAA